MKILHTADLHLKKIGDERWLAFKNILKLGEKEKIDVLICAGDFLDKDSAGDLREYLRSEFKNLKFKTFIIPGNHDEKILKEEGLVWGENVFIFREIGNVQEQNVLFHFLPFSDLDEDKTAEKIFNIKKGLNPDLINILVFHGELLDIIRVFDDFGEEQNNNYMPVYLKTFSGFDYVLAGHFHKSFTVKKINENGIFVYPGSPVSITKKEIGVRKVNIFSPNKPAHKFKPQPTIVQDNLHYEYVAIELHRNMNKSEFENTLTREKEKLNSNAIPRISVNGVFDKTILTYTEQEILSRIRQTFNVEPEEFSALDLSFIINNEIYKRFIELLNERSADASNEEKGLREIVERTLYEALKEGLA